jgi:hypothetical protein
MLTIPKSGSFSYMMRSKCLLIKYRNWTITITFIYDFVVVGEIIRKMRKPIMQKA